MVLPSGFWLGNDLRTSASFTTATKGLSKVSLSLKSRPFFKGIPSAANAPGVTMEITRGHSGPWYLTDPHSAVGQAAQPRTPLLLGVLNQLLARGLQRQPEYAIRSAMGAGRWRLFRQVLIESVALALVGSVFGATLAAVAVKLFKAIGGRAIPRSDAVTVGWHVFAFGLVAALIAAAFAGLLPAVRASFLDPYPALKGTRSSAGRTERLA